MESELVLTQCDQEPTGWLMREQCMEEVDGMLLIGHTVEGGCDSSGDGIHILGVRQDMVHGEFGGNPGSYPTGR